MKSDDLTVLIDLLKNANKLESRSDNLRSKDFESFKKLLKYYVILEDNTFWSHVPKCIIFIEDFLNEIIDTETFIYTFMDMYYSVLKETAKIKSDLKKQTESEISSADLERISKLFSKTQAAGITNLFSSVYQICDDFYLYQDSPSSEIQFKNKIKHFLKQIKQYDEFSKS